MLLSPDLTPNILGPLEAEPPGGRGSGSRVLAVAGRGWKATKLGGVLGRVRCVNLRCVSRWGCVEPCLVFFPAAVAVVTPRACEDINQSRGCFGTCYTP